MKYRLMFNSPLRKVDSGDRLTICFPYSILDAQFIGAPEENARTEHNEISVSVTGTLLAMWQNNDSNIDVCKVMFEYGRRHVIDKLLDQTLLQSEVLILFSHNVELPCPYDSSRIPNPADASYEVEVPKESRLEMQSDQTLAAAIIDTRDNVNAIFYERHKAKLFIINEERDLLQLFRDAITQEELSYRVCALANAATGMNVSLLRKLVANATDNDKSITLLQKHANATNIDLSSSIVFLRAINGLRKAYPVHTDKADDVLLSYRQLGLTYPLRDFSRAWAHLLAKYLAALQAMLDAFQQSPFYQVKEEDNCT